MNLLPALMLATSGLTAAAGAFAGSAITLYYEERAPYQMRVGERVEGNVASPAAQAFKAANVPFVWEASSISRQLHMLRENLGAYCVVGWYKTSERLAFGKFTKPIYRNGPVVALARRQLAFGPLQTVEQALSTPGLRLLVRDKYSYGNRIDGAIKRVMPATFASPLPNSKLTEKLIAGRADLMFTSEEEAAVLLRHLGAQASELQVLRFSDLAPGLERHIACSRSVPDEIIERLNSAITFK